MTDEDFEGIIEDLEAKLAKAVEALRDAVDAWDNHNKTGDMMQGHWVTDARTTLAEIEGGVCSSCREPLSLPSGDGCAAMINHAP
jgi:hypothetical protein